MRADMLLQEHVNFDEARRVTDELWRQILSLRRTVEGKREENDDNIPINGNASSEQVGNEQSPNIDEIERIRELEEPEECKENSQSITSAPSESSLRLSLQPGQPTEAELTSIIVEQRGIQKQIDEMREGAVCNDAEADEKLAGMMKHAKAAYGILRAKYNMRNKLLKEVVERLNSTVATQIALMDELQEAKRKLGEAEASALDSRLAAEKEIYALKCENGLLEDKCTALEQLLKKNEGGENANNKGEEITCPRSVFDRMIGALRDQAERSGELAQHIRTQELLNKRTIRTNNEIINDQEREIANGAQFFEIDNEESLSEDFLGFSLGPLASK